eukprot:2122131-Pleurochrysis_carterae.AAC.3
MRTDARNYRAILGLTGKMSAADVKRQWLALNKMIHPDKNKLDFATEATAKVNAAYRYYKEKILTGTCTRRRPASFCLALAC